MKHVFTDIDGTKYYRNSSNALVDHTGALMPLHVQEGIRLHCPKCGGSPQQPHRRWPSCVLCNYWPAQEGK